MKHKFLPSSKRNWLVLLLDTGISLVTSLMAVMLIRWMSEPFTDLTQFVYHWVIVSCLASILAFQLMETYRIMIFHSTYRSISRLIEASLLKEAILALFIMFKFFRVSMVRFEWLTVMADFLLTVFFLITVRLIIIQIYQNLRNSPEENIDRMTTMVYGIGFKSVAMLTRMMASPHYNIIGYISPNEEDEGLIIGDRKAYWCPDEKALDQLKIKFGLEGILFANSEDSEKEKHSLIPMCIENGIHILLSPKVAEVTPKGHGNEPGKISFSEGYIVDGMSSVEKDFKRCADFFLSGILLVLFSPLFLICFIAIKLEDHGPAIYKQERIGRFGRPFMIYKFRSMKMDAEAGGPALYAGDNDSRLTKVGGFLRRHHLDELPQLWNVFKGDMAFVGPRPERKYFIDQISEKDPRYYCLYQIRPGVTSYATFYNGYTDTLDKMVRRLEYDLYYLRHRSWWFDVKILGMTFLSIVFGKKF